MSSEGVSAADVRAAAIKLLATREHSAFELLRKLGAKGFPAALVDEVLQELQQEGFQSDERYAEAYVRLRKEKGYGPQRIRSELRERGIGDALIAAYLDPRDAEWWERLEAVRQKRFGSDYPKDYRERAKQARFLQYRGFSAEQIREVLEQND